MNLAMLRAGMRVLARHVRNSRGSPARLWWVMQRTMRIIASGNTRGVLERHSVLADLYSNYDDWIARFDTLDDSGRQLLRDEACALAQRPLFSVLVPTFASDPFALGAAIASVLRQLYPHWELCLVDDATPSPALHARLRAYAAADPRINVQILPVNGGIAVATNAALARASGDFVLFLDHDDLLSECALLRLAQAISARPETIFLYSDEDKIDEVQSRHSPHFKPDWNPEWAKTSNYVLHLAAVRTTAIRAVGGMRLGIDGAQDWDLLLRIVERHGGEGVTHVPHILYHWRERAGSTASGINQKDGMLAAQRAVLNAMLERRSIAATVESTVGGWWIRYGIAQPAPLVSIVVPTRDQGALLRKCVNSIQTHTAYRPYEIVIVDHESTEPTACEFIASALANGSVRVVPFVGPFNYAAECNLGVRNARGEVIVLLNNDVEVVSSGWLDELVGHALQSGVGIVGAKLLYPDRTIQHAGVMLGVNGTADRPYLGFHRGFAGIAGRALAAQNVTAIITACAAVRRDRYDAVGGMDETLPVSHNDLDLCLRFVDRGYRNVWTPHAELIHHESASRGYENSPEDRARAREEAARFRAKWGVLGEVDPCYNVNLADQGTMFALAFPPRLERYGTSAAHGPAAPTE